MFCKQCGQKLGDGMTQCPVCGTPAGNAAAASSEMEKDSCVKPVPPPQVVIDNGMVPAILATVCCCPPLGIAAVIYASRVSVLVEGGKLEEARHSAKVSKILSLIGIIIGLLWGFLQSVPYYLRSSVSFRDFIHQLLNM